MSDEPQPGSGAAWETVAPAWEQNRERAFEGFRHASEWLVRHVDPKPGDTVLDVAAGPGETGFLAAERVGPGGKLISTDISETMVAAARRGAEAWGLTNVECRVMDAQRLDLPDDSVDAVISRLGLMLVPDPRAALAEIRRVLRPGGRVAYAVMGPPDQNPWMGVMMGSLMAQGVMLAGGNPFELGGVFGMAAPEVNERLLREAGFDDVHAEQLPGSMSFESPAEYWDFQGAMAEPVRGAVAGMSDEQVAAARASVEEMMAPFESGGRYELPSLATVAAAH